MKPRSYYNDFEPYCVEWTKNLIKAGLIPDGDVDSRSITEVQPDDLKGYTHVHFFNEISGWAYAARLAGWPENRELWTGSPPCQPYSVAGNQKGQEDERHLWPHYYRLVCARRPAVIFGEEVAAAIGHGWIDGVFADMEKIDYSGRVVVLPVCAVNAPHRRDRLFFVAERSDQSERCGNIGLSDQSALGDAHYARLEERRNGLDEQSGAEGREGPERSSGLSGVHHDDASGAMAFADRERRDRREVASGGHDNDGRTSRREESANRAELRDEASSAMAYTDEPGTREGWEQRSGQQCGTGGDPEDRDGVRNGSMAHAASEGLSGRDAGTIQGRPESERQAEQLERRGGSGGDVANADSAGLIQGIGDHSPSGHGHSSPATSQSGSIGTNFWADHQWLIGPDQKARRVKPGLLLLAHGISGNLAVRRTIQTEDGTQIEEEHWYNRIGAIKAFGNAIVPELAAEFIKAYLDCRP